MKVTALLTGRGNNSLKDKNILDVLGKPVIYYPAKAGIKAHKIDSFYCSSDDKKILDITEKLGYIPIVRPAELAGPKSQHIDCIMHGLHEIVKKESKPDILVVILANNITIKSSWIDDCVEVMEKDYTITGVVPVYEDNDHHPLRAKTVHADGTLGMYEKGITGKVSTNRQDLPECLFLSHNFWVLNTDFLLSGQEGQPPWSFLGNKIMPYRIDESIDIHKEVDLLIAKEWIKHNYSD